LQAAIDFAEAADAELRGDSEAAKQLEEWQSQDF